MARLPKTTRKRVDKPLTTWTRFYLPREQEWPTWSVDHTDIHVGPLSAVDGCGHASLGRMVDDPEQAAYILDWNTLDDLTNFQSSAACADFLRNLPEHGPTTSPVPGIELGWQMVHLTLDDASPWSAPLEPSSRFLTLKHFTEAATATVDGRVTFTTFMVPRTVDNAHKMWKDDFQPAFSGFRPRGSRYSRSTLSSTWFEVLEEDRWVGEQFGGLEQHKMDGDGHDLDHDHDQGRTLFCRFHLWSGTGATPEDEATSAADPQVREYWDRTVAKVMPPASAYHQECWDIQEIPRFFPSEPEYDPEEEVAECEEQKRAMIEYLALHGYGPRE